MPINGSIIITRQVENLREAASLARDLATSVATVLHQQLSPYYEEGETPIDFELLQKVAGRWIDAKNNGLSDAQYRRQHLRNLERHFRDLAKEAADELPWPLLFEFFLRASSATVQSQSPAISLSYAPLHMSPH